MRVITFKMKEELYEKVMKIAFSKKMYVSEIIREAIKNYLEMQDI